MGESSRFTHNPFGREALSSAVVLGLLAAVLMSVLALLAVLVVIVVIVVIAVRGRLAFLFEVEYEAHHRHIEVVKLHGEGAIKRRIMDMGLTKGVEVYVRKVAPLGDPVEVTVRGYELSLRKADAEMVEVE